MVGRDPHTVETGVRFSSGPLFFLDNEIDYEDYKSYRS